MSQKKMVERRISVKNVELIKVDEEEAAKRVSRKKMERRHSNLTKLPSSIASGPLSELDFSYPYGSLIHKRVISFFLNLLHDGESVRALCVEALVVIFEKGCVEKFSAEAYKAFMQSLDEKDDELSYFEEWKYEIVEQVSAVCNPNWKVSKLFEEGRTLKKYIFICGNSLKLSSVAQFKKFNFIKQFLGDGFETHMMENEFLHSVLRFKVKEAPNGPELYVPESEEVTVRYFSLDIRKDKCKERFERSPNSLVSKARTQLMKKHRILAQERKTGFVSVGEEDG